MTSAYVGTVGQLKQLHQQGKLQSALEVGYLQQYGKGTPSQEKSWEYSLPVVLALLEDPKFDRLEALVELRMPIGDERADLVLLGGGHRALVLELKAWSSVEPRGDFYLVGLRGDARQQHPSLQALNYQGKLRMLHSVGHGYQWKAAAILHNLSSEYAPALEIDPEVTKAAPVIYKDDLTTFADRCARWLLESPPIRGAARELDEGPFEQTATFFEVINKHGKDILNNAAVGIANSGTGLTEEQQLIVEDVFQAVSRGESKVFAINGGPGSGKSLVAVHLLIRAFAARKRSILALRNNRLMAVLRASFRAVNPELPSFTIFNSVPRTQRGLGDKGFQGQFDLVVCDEAQRFGLENIPVIMQRAPVVVFFYDETQILNMSERGTLHYFEEYARKLDKPVEKRQLTAAMRSRGGAPYHEFVENVLQGKKTDSTSWRTRYQFRVFENIDEMLEALRGLRNGHRVALVASFTESPGSLDAGSDHIDNVRIGYPLKSGLILYKNLGTQISWLMNPDKDYKPFWMDGRSSELNRVASIYGCQGFESDYVGVIWGRDFVWRSQGWEVGDSDYITDTIDRPVSMKKVAKNQKGDAMRLLQNRYRVFLTRGMLGTFIYCEDPKTLRHLRQIVE